MRKFYFSLQKVLEIKEQILKNLKSELNNFNQQLKNIEYEIVSLLEKYDETNKEFNEKSSVSISVGEMSYYKMYMSSMLRYVEKKEDDKLQLNKKIESKRREIINMNIEISSLEKLREKELMKYNEALMKSEEIFIDEFVANSRMIKQYMF
ncbi:flagellar FliJ protein [Sedimentibacter acidaminivorans]|uniref:Flagellar FliJ protein n=1 Tax=Sedimentibacter acidaminivorans TaxID=913099 RepID=A0ABS4GDH4_9FIRM|nr:flagellar export protein FliJ [Sedimentibacter acidaminivorans]MBP1925751.1 flagellar FliJ protein [Sedimentibacter acidaminivorans]